MNQESAVDEILERGTIVDVLPSRADFRERLLGGEKMRFYIGFDATASTLHLSHAKNIILLEKFRRLGHEVILMFGDFTARIGDPTGEDAKRKQLSKEEVLKNVEAWKEQIAPLMDFEAKENPPRVRFNSEWLTELSFEDVIELASNFTVQQMLERDMFERRISNGDPVGLHEFLYPLMQGYDSVALEADVELCGTDQTFNALAGRTLLKKIKNKDKFVVVVTLMEDPETGELMSKSKGTGVFLNTDAREKFGQVMALGDGMIEPILRHVTDVPLDEIAGIMAEDNPRNAKLRAAYEVVSLFHGVDAADREKQYFIETFSKKSVDAEMLDVLRVKEGEDLVEVLLRDALASSKGDARRKIEQGGVSIDGEKVEDVQCVIQEDMSGKVLKVGKKDFRKIELESKESSESP